MKSTYSKSELIREVEKGTKVGKLIIKAEMEYLKALASGEVYDSLKKERKK